MVIARLVLRPADWGAGGSLRLKGKLEATPGIEPGYADLQSAASPLRHVASGFFALPGINPVAGLGPDIERPSGAFTARRTHLS